MQPAILPNDTVVITGISNREFLKRYAGRGRIGLSGGISLVDKAICRAERHLDEAEKWGSWSHAFFLQGERADGHHWVIESDLQIHRKHIQLGVQENRVSKYFDEDLYTTLAVLDFGLSEPQVTALVHEALELVANRAHYSLRELLGTLIALRRPELRTRTNLLARESALYCSAFVHHLFRKGGLDLAPGLELKHTTPEHISRTVLPHVTYLLKRDPVASRVAKIKARLHDRVGGQIQRLKQIRVRRAQK